jgi:hypothetical protein
MEKASPLKIYPKKYSIGTKSNPANFANAIKIILFLYQRVIILVYCFLELRYDRLKLRSATNQQRESLLFI